MTDRTHNEIQRAHYAGAGLVSPRMQPVDTPYVRRHVARLVEALDLRPGERVLDVGCGLGKFTRLLADVHGVEVEGLDLSSALLDAFSDDRPGVVLHEGDLLDPPPALLGQFDAITGFFMLHHLPALAPAFTAVTAMLRPGGRAGFVEPNALCPLFWLQITLTPGLSWAAERGVLRMTRRRLVDSMRAGGLVGVEHSRQGLLPPVLVNRPAGERLDDAVDGVALLDPVRAFAVVTGRRPG